MKTDNANRLADFENRYIPGFKGISKKTESKKLVAKWRPFWLSVESRKYKQIAQQGFNVCTKYEFNLLQHVGVVAKRLRAGAAVADTAQQNQG